MSQCRLSVFVLKVRKGLGVHPRQLFALKEFQYTTDFPASIKSSDVVAHFFFPHVRDANNVFIIKETVIVT